MKYYTTTKISENIHATPEGFLLCIGVPLGGIEEMVYGPGETPLEPGPDGKVIIDRDPEELFRPETIASLEGKPFTIRHPENFVDPTNWGALAKGILQNVRRGEGEDKNKLLSDILVTDVIAIGLIKSGLREVSLGYEAEYTQTGIGRGKQTNIIGNHLALVEEGRAGPAYAITDHKKSGKEALTMKKKFSDKLKELFAKTADEAQKVLDEMPDAVTDEEKKPVEEKAKDEKKDDDKKDEAKDEGAACYDELVQMVKDLGEKISAMAPKKASDEDKEKPVEEKAKDEGGSVEDRLKALEMAVAKIMQGESEEDLAVDEDKEEEAVEDDDIEEETVMTGDAIARAEILAPGLDASHKSLKIEALKKAYATKEGKAVIESLTGGKVPTYDSAEKVDTLFIAASELLKAKRSGEFSKTKQTRDTIGDSARVEMTPERMNELNAKRYGLSN